MRASLQGVQKLNSRKYDLPVTQDLVFYYFCVETRLAKMKELKTMTKTEHTLNILLSFGLCLQKKCMNLSSMVVYLVIYCIAQAYELAKSYLWSFNRSTALLFIGPSAAGSSVGRHLVFISTMVASHLSKSVIDAVICFTKY